PPTTPSPLLSIDDAPRIRADALQSIDEVMRRLGGRYDRTIVPGTRAGSIGAATSHAELAAIFGADQVELGEIDVGEGFTEPGSIVFPDDPANRLEIVWEDATRTA